MDINSPFDELPEGLVDDLLSSSKVVSINMKEKFESLIKNRSQLREKLDSEISIKNYNDLGNLPTFPTSAATDGSYTIDRLLSSDFASVAAVAVEGLTPPSENRKWPKPRYFSHVDNVEHNEETSQILRGMSAGLEVYLAQNAPHDVLFLDGSMKTPLIYLNNATEHLDDGPKSLVETFINGKDYYNEDKMPYPNFVNIIDAYLEVVESQRSDKIYAAVPKYTTKNEICQRLNLDNFEDRGLLTFLLKSNEYLVISSQDYPSKVHDIDTKSSKINKILKENIIYKVKKIVENLKQNINVVYFKPSKYAPVLRVETSSFVTDHKQRLGILLEAISLQMNSLSLMEPYPLYLADRMVKNLSTALPAVKEEAFKEVIDNWKGDISEIYMAMHGYRTEGR